MDKNKLGWEILKGIGKTFLFIAAIPGALFFVLLLFGINSDTGELVIPLEWVSRIGPLSVVLLIYGVTIQVSHRIIEQMKKDFYSGSLIGRKERAYRNFYQHWLDGVSRVRDNPTGGVLHEQWDLQTKNLLRRYCTPGVLGTYLDHTGRSRFEEDRVFEPQQCKNAVNFIQSRLLNSDFEGAGTLNLLLGE